MHLKLLYLKKIKQNDMQNSFLPKVRIILSYGLVLKRGWWWLSNGWNIRWNIIVLLKTPLGSYTCKLFFLCPFLPFTYYSLGFQSPRIDFIHSVVYWILLHIFFSVLNFYECVCVCVSICIYICK